MITRLKIRGGRVGASARGQDVSVLVVDERGVEHHLACQRFRIVCDSRKSEVECHLSIAVDEIDLDGLVPILEKDTSGRRVLRFETESEIRENIHHDCDDEDCQRCHHVTSFEIRDNVITTPQTPPCRSRGCLAPSGSDGCVVHNWR